MDPQPSSVAAQRQLIFDVQRTFNETLEGQRLWKHLEDVCYAKKTTVDKDKLATIDPLKMAFNEGCRSVYLHLQTLKNIDKEQYEAKIKEQEKDNATG